MIIIYHQDHKVKSIWNTSKSVFEEISDTNLVHAFFKMATLFSSELIIWCHISQKDNINFEGFSSIFHHQKIMVSYNLDSQYYFSEKIGYVDDSVYVKINKNVEYPTWQMSSCIGGIQAEIILQFNQKLYQNVSFDYLLNSIARASMTLGILCYSSPKLLINNVTNFNSPKASIFSLFRFVKQHYLPKWVMVLAIAYFVFHKRLTILPFFYSLFFSKNWQSTLRFDTMEVNSSRNTIEQETIDVIIPTIGRKQYLYDVLKDLSIQTVLPKKVIIVEQNTLSDSVTELDYIISEKWPFQIDHIFTHQAGACNARNCALAKVESEWVFLNDDDNRFTNTLLADVFKNVKKYGITALTTSYRLPSEKMEYKIINQSGIFGSGNSFIKSSILSFVAFDPGFEFGYGEDNDFGCQLRNNGHDIIYFPDIEITHLKAPMGGFRIPQIFEWNNDIIQPKPSPTIMLLKIKNATQTQVLGYKLLLFLKLNGLNVFALNDFNKKWQRSQFWAMNLLKKNKNRVEINSQIGK